MQATSSTYGSRVTNSTFGKRIAIAIAALVAGCGLDVMGSTATDADANWPTYSTPPSSAPPEADGGNPGLGPDRDASSDGSSRADGSVDPSTADAGACAPCGRQASRTLCVANACVPTRRVFVSSAAFTADLGGPLGADAQCQNLAKGAQLGGKWKAWISSSTSSPSTRFTKSTVAYRLLNGTLVARDWSELTSGALSHGIDRDENGTLTPNAEVWTGTTTAGTSAGDGCFGFTSASDEGPPVTQGTTAHKNGKWTDVYLQHCDRTNPRIYCFEQ